MRAPDDAVGDELVMEHERGCPGPREEDTSEDGPNGTERAQADPDRRREPLALADTETIAREGDAGANPWIAPPEPTECARMKRAHEAPLDEPEPAQGGRDGVEGRGGLEVDVDACLGGLD